jgi:hypothetical protein
MQNIELIKYSDKAAAYVSFKIIQFILSCKKALIEQGY